MNDRIKIIEGTGLKSSSRGNYYRSIVKFIEFIRDSPAVALNAAGYQLSNEQDMRLSRSIDAWCRRTKITSKLAKREAIQSNTQENFRSNNQWGSTTEMRSVAMRVVNVLKKITQQTGELTEDQRKEFGDCLFTVMLLYRPGRPGSTAGLYVCARLSYIHSFGLECRCR
jgi:hypothetical protein